MRRDQVLSMVIPMFISNTEMLGYRLGVQARESLLELGLAVVLELVVSMMQAVEERKGETYLQVILVQVPFLTN
jgi:hypothetical protein